MKIRLGLILIVLGLVITSCSGEVKPPTCDVRVEGNRIIVGIDLPAEGMEYRGTHDLTPPGFTGTPSKLTVTGGGSSVNYSKTGNSYDIAYSVTYEKGEITTYQISIKSDVYGDIEHTCSK